ncbi:tetratricopeptide repeat protein [Microvirga tunisiensis]|uniref:Tetratricopeptide repeat protein n=1 Tax=Pannonibacter tanglangensis TaxID=2750084 RepID=A0A7X5F273_9HYPH|nr:tetratricopeptide repeat protein [Pannonibacter sp. XCT-53]NBN78328.1 tetratricopeptide repeat protein [Pannonibacter sp. XCT-53]
MNVKSAAAGTLETLRKALALQQAGEIEKAQRLYKAVLKKNPTSADALNLLGVTYRQLGFPKRAVEFIRKAIALAPDRGPYHANLARALSDLPETTPQEILEAAERALGFAPQLPEARNLKAISLTKLGREAEAEELLLKLIADQPSYADAYRNYGILLRDREDHQKALEFFDTAVQLDPSNAETWVQRARARFELEQYDQDLRELLVAEKLFPQNGDIQHELARLYFRIGDSHLGLPHAEAAVAAEPTNAGRLVTLGVIYQTLRRSKDALDALAKARANWFEDIPTAEWNMSLAYLGLGNLELGWKMHSARFRTGLSSTLARKFERPEWDGSDLSGKTILLWNDQGVGDAFRSGTMIPEIIAQAGHVIVELSQKLLPPFQRSFPEATVRLATFESVTLKATQHDYDCQICISDLAHYLRKDFPSFRKARHPVFRFNQDRAREFHDRIPDARAKPVVGVSWRSRNLSPARAKSYLSVPEFAPIVETPGIIFVDLQYIAIAREIDFLVKGRGANLVHFEDVDQFNNLEDAAALANCCDLVLTVNTSVSDIAGSHGLPCWTFGQEVPQFMLGQEVTPWYDDFNYTVLEPGQPVVTLVPELVSRLEHWRDHDWSPEARLTRLGLGG